MSVLLRLLSLLRSRLGAAAVVWLIELAAARVRKDRERPADTAPADGQPSEPSKER